MKTPKQKYCRYCGEPIHLIRTSPNKTTPCNAEPVPYWQHFDGKSTVITADGDVVQAVIEGARLKDGKPFIPTTPPEIGYTPHRSSCPNYKNKEVRG